MKKKTFCFVFSQVVANESPAKNKQANRYDKQKHNQKDKQINHKQMLQTIKQMLELTHPFFSSFLWMQDYADVVGSVGLRGNTIWRVLHMLRLCIWTNVIVFRCTLSGNWPIFVFVSLTL